jgi:exosortase D (VPLPA-CTERM-specific)
MTREMKNKALFWISLVVMLGAFGLQFYEDFGNLMIRWNSDDFSYCYLVPFVFIYLVYTNRQSLAGKELRSSATGLVVLLIAGIVYLGGKLGSVETLVYMAIWFAVVGMALSAVGFAAVKTFAFPFVILAFIVPLPPFLNQLFTFKLKLISSALSVNMMRAAGLSVFREGNIIDLGITQLQVVDACSGLRYVYPLVLMGLVFAYLFHKKWWERIVIIGATIPISVLSNAIRIAITGYLTLKVSPEAAEGFFHGFSGWLIFMVSFVFLAILSWLLKVIRTRVLKQIPVRVEKGDGAPFAIGFENARPVYLSIAAALFVGFWAIHGAFASGQIRPDRKPFDLFPTEIGDWRGEKSYLTEEILQSLWADDYVQIQFADSGSGDALLLFVPYYEYQGTRHTAHSPVACIVGGGGFAPRSARILPREFPMPFGKVKIKQMVFEKGNEFLLSNYWFQQRGRIIVSEYWNKWYMFLDSITQRRTDGALVRIEMVVRPGQTVEAAQAVMDAFTMELMKILPEYVPN